MLIRLILLILISLLNACTIPEKATFSNAMAYGVKANENAVAPVSLHLLIANPEAFDGRRIKTTGYVNIEFEGDALFLDRSSYTNKIYLNAVVVQFEREKLGLSHSLNPELSGNIATIEATFHGALPEPPCAGYPKTDGDHKLECISVRPDYGGVLSDITYIEFIRDKTR